ncbi:NfeD family protein [Parasphingorhabdus cellanae]|uniref:NfeD family protein n=2 Tax=Parasphingorhabdus cellanae TaxID=2806553 RepID=A0ABX7TB78_9SPHN|nr:NfeD family protein [Parasphingorhabdus cellanae]
MGLESHYHWLIIALLLGIGEILVPGVFLIWLAAAAAITGFVAMFIDITVAGQFTLFGLLSLASVFLGRRWYLTHVVKSEDPLLNDRAARLIGMTVTVVKPINATSGRVKVGDSEWSARGPALAKGSSARIIDVANGILILEEIPEELT